MAETDNSHNLRNRLLGRIHENDIHELCHVIQCCEDHSLLEPNRLNPEDVHQTPPPQAGSLSQRE